MGDMRALRFLVLFPLLAFGGVDAPLQKVQNIYVLSMGGGMDQFLANRLARTGLVQVAADPKTADTILTDRLGQAFEQKMDELYPAAPPAKDPDDDSKSDKKFKTPDEPTHLSSFSRGRGTYFLVDRRTRQVVWSIYERPKNTSPDELNRTAAKVIDRLKHDLQGKQQE